MKTNPKDVFLQEAAPRGATHYRENKNGYERFKIDTSVYEQDPKWEWEILTSDPVDVSGWLDCVTEIPKPSHQETPDNSWDGEGMPPAGTLCEVFYRGDWYKTYIIGTAQNGATVYCSKNIHNDQIYDGHQNPECFRPIRTEREKFTTKVREIFGKVESQVISDLANALYDANARFPEDSK